MKTKEQPQLSDECSGVWGISADVYTSH